MKSSARASVPKSLYSKTALAAAAIALGQRARVSLSARGPRWIIEVSAEGRNPADLLLAQFLNEALSQNRRQAQLKQARPFAAAIISRLLTNGFVRPPADPLEELEPQVRADRIEETAQLMQRARGVR